MSLLDRLQSSPLLSEEARDRLTGALSDARNFHFAAVRTLVEGDFSAADFAAIASLAIVEYDCPDDRPIEVSHLLQIALNRLQRMRAAPEDLVRLTLEVLARDSKGPLACILAGFLRDSGPFCDSYPALLVAELKQAGVGLVGVEKFEPRAKPATFRDESDWLYNGWEAVEEGEPLAGLLFALDAAAPVEELLSSPPRSGVPEISSIHYLLLRRLWQEPAFAATPGTLAGLGRLARNTSAEPSLAALHDRALAVFVNRWRASFPYGLTEVASEVSHELGCELEGANRLYLEMLNEPPVKVEAPSREPELLPSEAALQRKIEAALERLAHQPSSMAWGDLAALYREARDWGRVIEAETHVIEEMPSAAGAYYGRAKAWISKHNYEAAAADLTKAITIWEFPDGIRKFLEFEQPQPPYIDSYRTRGMARAHLGDYASGIDDLATALRLSCNDPRLHYERAYLLEKAKRVREALAEYHRAGLLYLDNGKRKEAENCVEALERLGSRREAGDLRSRLAPAENDSDLPL